MRTLTRRTLALGATVAIAAGGVATAAALEGGGEDRSAAIAGVIDPSVPKNVILMIGDGMGESEITAARAYQGFGTRLAMDTLPFRGVATNYMISAVDNDRIEPVTDSAAGGSSIATGRKTIVTRISQAPTESLSQPGANEGYETILEKAQRLGKRTGNVTTAFLTDATPAAQIAHISNRSCMGPAEARVACPQETKDAGGLGSIAEQAVDSGADLLLGSGRASFAQRLDGLSGDGSDGRTVLEYATEDRGYRLVRDAEELAAVDSVADRPVLGLFTDEAATEFDGVEAALAPGNTPTPGGRCDEQFRVREHPDHPSLAAMTRKSIELLENEKGFFLQVEGAMIDHEAHTARPCGQIGETLGFDDAVGVALEYQREHPDTLVLVTADHGHSGQITNYIGPNGPVPTGYFQTITTRDGNPLVMSYGLSGGREGQQPVSPAAYQNHSGTSVPVMAIGPQAANVSGMQDLTDLHRLLAFELTPSKLPENTVTVTVPGETTTVTTPGETRTVTTPGLERTVERPRALSAAVAAPRTLTLRDARRSGIPVSLLASGDGTTIVRLLRGGRAIAQARGTVRADRARSVTLRPGRRLARAAKLQVRIDVRAADGARDRATSTLRIRR